MQALASNAVENPGFRLQSRQPSNKNRRIVDTLLACHFLACPKMQSTFYVAAELVTLEILRSKSSLDSICKLLPRPRNEEIPLRVVKITNTESHDFNIKFHPKTS